MVEFFNSHFDPVRDTVDILLVTAGIYWLLLLIRGTRAIQILVGLIVLIALFLASELFQLAALGMILERFLGSAVLIIVILFQNDIRRALARVGRGFFPSFSAEQELQVVEEIVRAAGILSQRRHGALIVLERESNLGDLIEAGIPVDARLSKELLTSIFQPSSPMHDGAVVIQDGRISSAGCILPLTLRTDLPEGLGTRHRAAVGITEETDALVVVVSEETAKISIVLGGEMLQGLDAPRLRVVLRDILGGERKELPEASEVAGGLEIADHPEVERATAS
ncbi:MAG TPA: TIGR00159 family protein [Deltaproteobacteria bacterium]|nr:TIGR00159 family protein [Deltaproteobacteria bacterium]